MVWAKYTLPFGEHFLLSATVCEQLSMFDHSNYHDRYSVTVTIHFCNKQITPFVLLFPQHFLVQGRELHHEYSIGLSSSSPVDPRPYPNQLSVEDHTPMPISHSSGFHCTFIKVRSAGGISLSPTSRCFPCMVKFCS